MHSDSVFIIGDGHKVCEDYARHGDFSNGSYALLSDGCSGSKDTDIGARLVVNAAESFVVQYGAPQSHDDCRHIITSADYVVRIMNMPQECLDVTLLGVLKDESGVYLWGSGDGFLSISYEDGYVRIYDISADSGYPVYPSYILNKERRKRVIETGGWRVGESKYKDGSCYESDGAIYYSKDVDLFSGKFENSLCEKMISIAVFSDGIDSFVDENREPIPAWKIVLELMSFKGFKGQFAQRRMQAFLKSARKRGWTHFDDLSMAAVCG